MIDFTSFNYGAFFAHRYVKAVLIIFIAFIIANVVIKIFKYFITKEVDKKEEAVNKRMVLQIEHPLIVLIILVGAELALNTLSVTNLTYSNILKTVMVIVITYMFIGISILSLNLWQKQHQRENVAFHAEVMPLMRSLIRIVLILTAVIITLQLWSVEIMTLLTSLGIMGIILGFAFKDSMVNIFGGMSLIMDDSLRKRDIIELATGEKGEVVEINLRSTKIKTFTHNYLIIPNGVLANAKFYNYAQPSTTYRITVDFSVVYGSDIEQVKEVALSVLKNRKDILKFPKRSVRFVEMSDYSLKLKLLFFIDNYIDMFDIKDEITTKLYDALRENNISIPFPTRTVYNVEPVKASKTRSSKATGAQKSKTSRKKVVKKIKKVKKKVTKKKKK